jgi:DNA transposition AAA+ family ATPase
MEINQQFKQQVIDAVKKHRNFFEGSDSKHAVSLGLSPAQYSRIMSGELDRVLSDAKWITLSRMMEQKSGSDSKWKAAETPVFVSIQNTLKRCQKNALSALICDAADIGKTFGARYYVASNKNAIYVDCSQVKSKQKLVRKIAKEFGVAHTGKYAEIYEDLVYYLNYINNPMIILDEAGDLNYEAFLELKALWNATERHCGWAMIGADGLKEKIRRAKDNKKVGYAEMFSRYGSRYQRITPDGKDESKQFTTLQAALIIKANAPKGTDVQGMLRKTDGSLRRIYNEVSKLA